MVKMSTDQCLAITAIISLVFTVGYGISTFRDFSASVDPMLVDVDQGSTTHISVEVRPGYLYNEDVSLRAVSVPSFINVYFEPQVLKHGVSQVIISAEKEAPPGEHLISVVIDGADGKEHVCKFTLKVNGSTSTPTETPASTINSTPKNVATSLAVSSRAHLNNGTSTSEAASDIEFPEYNVGISGIKLSSPYRTDFSAIVKELNSSGINTIFLSVDSTDVGQYERFIKMAHEKEISVHAVLLEDVNCTENGAEDSCEDTINKTLDYNEKSLAPFDGIDIYINASAGEGSEDTIDYRKLFEMAKKEAKGNVSISASLPLNYTASRIEGIAPFVDSFIVRAYPGKTEELNSVSGIVDAISLQMREIRGAGSKGIIEISAEEGFKDKFSIQELFAGLADYYSSDSAFLGVSIFDYYTYRALPRTQPEEEKSSIPGFNALSVLLAGLGVFALLKVKRN